MAVHAGDWIEIRSKQDILRTLDKKGCRDGLPFMPEMFEYCGRRVRIASSAHKTCGPVDGRYVPRQTKDLVHLGFRCNGKAHDGCQNGCQFFWHKDWLRADGSEASAPGGEQAAGCTEADVTAATRRPSQDGQTRYACQALALKDFTTPLNWWDARAYWKSYRTRNYSLSELVSGISFLAFSVITGTQAQRFGARRIYDAFQAWRGGTPFPRRPGLVPDGQPTPTVELGLKAGDWVRIKPYEEILKTLSRDCRNRGMVFDAELVPFCGRVFRVETMVERFIDEEAGVMRHMKTPAAILENVYCLSLYSGKRAFCTRGYYSWWREAWLEPVTQEAAAAERAARQRAAAARQTEQIAVASSAEPTERTAGPLQS